MLQKSFFFHVPSSKRLILGSTLFSGDIPSGSLGPATVHGDGDFHSCLCVISPANTQRTGFIPWLVLLLLGHSRPWRYQDPPVGEMDWGPLWPGGDALLASKGLSSPTMGVFLSSLRVSPAHFPMLAPRRPPRLSQAGLKPANECRSDKEGTPRHSGTG